MKKVLFFCLLALFACSDKASEQSEHLINKELIVAILADISKANAAVEIERIDNNELITARKLYAYQTIFNHYEITEAQFKESYQIYIADFDSAAALYDKVLERLSIEEIELNKTDNNE